MFLEDDGPPGSLSVKSQFGSERGKARVAYGKEAESLSEDLDITLGEAEDLVSRWCADEQEH